MPTQRLQAAKTCESGVHGDPQLEPNRRASVAPMSACKPAYHVYSRLITTIVEAGRWLARPAAFSGFACCHSHRGHAVADHELEFAPEARTWLCPAMAGLGHVAGCLCCAAGTPPAGVAMLRSQVQGQCKRRDSARDMEIVHNCTDRAGKCVVRKCFSSSPGPAAIVSAVKRWQQRITKWCENVWSTDLLVQ